MAPVAAQEAGAAVAFTNPVVNAPDTTVHDTQSTTSIVLGSGSTVIAAFNNLALNNGSNLHQVGWSRSTNNGTSWTDLGALPSSAGGDFGFPSLARNQTSGKIYLAVQPFGFATTGLSGTQMFESTDDGQTWASPVNAMPGFGLGDTVGSPRVAVDNFPGPGQGNVYVVARNAIGTPGVKTTGVYLSKSTDGGATFLLSPAGNLSSGGVGPTVVVGPDHAVYVFWWINLGGVGPPGGPQIRFVKSTNQGVSFGPITTAAFLQNVNGNGDLGLSFSTNSFPQVAIDPANGFIILVYNDKDGADKGSIFVTTSDNGGASWDNPDRINDDATQNDQFMPSIAFTPDGRHVMVSWYDRRNDPANALIERYGLIATFSGDPANPIGVTVSGNFKISTGSWPVAIGQDSFVGAAYMGTYDGMAADNNFFYVAWGDNRLADAAHAHQPDVRVEKVPVSYAHGVRGDFDADAKADITVFRPGNGTWFTLQSSTSTLSSVTWGAPTDLPVPGDYDGDGTGDIAVYRPSTGTWYILASTAGFISVSWGAPGDMPVPADYDHDGKTDIAIYRPSEGTWFILRSTNFALMKVAWGGPGDMPVFGADFDGDAVADIAVFRPSTGTWYLLRSADGFKSVSWGAPGDVPLVGDFDGEGASDIAVYRPSTGQWFILGSSPPHTPIQVAWGTVGDIPVPADFDGDGVTDIAVYRPSTGTWFILPSTTKTLTAVPWGGIGDIPILKQP